jgi:hypothetical protein
MKTMTKNSATKKLEKLTVKTESNKYPLSKNSRSYHFAQHVISGAKEIRPCYTSGKGRFCSNLDYTEETKAVLTKIGIEFDFSNDSKRGGLTGNLLTITTKIK